jgi:hypothetical protein
VGQADQGQKDAEQQEDGWPDPAPPSCEVEELRRGAQRLEGTVH